FRLDLRARGLDGPGDNIRAGSTVQQSRSFMCHGRSQTLVGTVPQPSVEPFGGVRSVITEAD
ncbi:MAG: hypothetical protein AB1Z65_08670, partial [Candidatus Sulfomarinibacteraceae bacterium]